MTVRSKIFRIFWLWVLVILILPVNCKKGITTPEQMPVIWINTSALAFDASHLGPNPSAQVMVIKNTGYETLIYNLSEDSEFYGNSWINISPTNGAANVGQEVEHTVAIDKSSLTPREEPYTAKISVQSSNAYNSPQTVDVSLIVTDKAPARIDISPSRLEFEGNVGGSNPAAKTFRVRNGGEETLQYTVASDVSWLDVSPLEGTLLSGESTHTAEVTIGNLGQGTHNGAITITDPEASNNPQTIAVTLELSDIPPPVIEVSPATLTFDAQVGSVNPNAQKIQVRNSGDGTLNYQVTWDANWLNVVPVSGKSRGPTKNHTVSISVSGLSAGIYTGSIQVSDPSATNSPQTVRVTLNMTAQPPTPPPPPPPPPSTNNEIWIDCSPSSGGIGTVVTITVGITGNTTEITAFGMELTYDNSLFSYAGFSRGNLAGGFAFFDANDVGGGKIKIGAFLGSIPVSSSGTLIELQFQVAGSNATAQFSIDGFTDGIQSMKPAPGSVTFIVN